MKPRLFFVILVLFALVAGVQAKVRPIVQARDHLGKAISALSNVESGAKGKKRHASIAGVVGELNRAEAKLQESKNNKGSNTEAALKHIADAKIELEAANDGDDASKHLQKARESMDEAMRRVKMAVADK